MVPGILVESELSETPFEVKSKQQDRYGYYHPKDPRELKLQSNFGPMDAEQIGYLQPTSANTPMDIMRDRYFRDGYLHV